MVTSPDLVMETICLLQARPFVAESAYDRADDGRRDRVVSLLAREKSKERRVHFVADGVARTVVGVSHRSLFFGHICRVEACIYMQLICTLQLSQD